MAESDLTNSGNDGNNSTHDTDRTLGTGGTDGAEGAKGEHVLGGRGLRFVLVDELRKRGTLTVAEMVQLLNRWGFSVDGRASKVISDSLRWERARGRVVRVARGVYVYGRTLAGSKIHCGHPGAAWPGFGPPKRPAARFAQTIMNEVPR